MSENQITVLILEDDQALALSWQQGFEEHGDRAIIASTATQALELLDSTPIDVLISDMYIYVGDKLGSDGGVKLIGLLRAAGSPSERIELPIIAITGQPQDSRFMPPVLELAKSLGADLCLEKPISVSTLVHTTHDLLRNPRGEVARSRRDEA